MSEQNYTAISNHLQQEIERTLKSNPTELYLSGQPIDDTIVSTIVEHQLKNPTISILNLSKTKISDDGAKALIKLIENSNTLTHVYVNDNGGMCKGSHEELESALIKNKNIIGAKTDAPAGDISGDDIPFLNTLCKVYNIKDENCTTQLALACRKHKLEAIKLTHKETSLNDTYDFEGIRDRMAAIVAVANEYLTGDDKTVQENRQSIAIRLKIAREEASKHNINIEIPNQIWQLAATPRLRVSDIAQIRLSSH